MILASEKELTHHLFLYRELSSTIMARMRQTAVKRERISIMLFLEART